MRHRHPCALTRTSCLRFAPGWLSISFESIEGTIVAFYIGYVKKRTTATPRQTSAKS
jgi:hypothetical protein